MNEPRAFTVNLGQHLALVRASYTWMNAESLHTPIHSIQPQIPESIEAMVISKFNLCRNLLIVQPPVLETNAPDPKQM